MSREGGFRRKEERDVNLGRGKIHTDTKKGAVDMCLLEGEG